MAEMKWNETATRLFKTGVSHGVLHVEGDSVAVPWSGLTSVAVEPSGGEHTALYFDGRKVLDHVAREDANVLLECVSTPVEFDRCDGIDGVYTLQRRRRFNLAWRSLIGNDVDGVDHGYELHLLYNCTALPTRKMTETIGQQTTLAKFSWNIHATPPAEGAALIRPAPHIVLNTNDHPDSIDIIEGILYGDEDTDPVFPDYPDVEVIVDNNDGGTVGDVQLNFTVSDSFVVPLEVSVLDHVLLVGPGGCGGRSTRGGGGGGGGDVLVLTNVPVTPGETITIELGTPATIPASSNTSQIEPGESTIMVGSVSGPLGEAIAGGNGGGADNSTSAQPGACGGGGAGGTSGNNNLGGAGSTGGDGGTGRGTIVTTTRAGGGGGGMLPENGSTATSSANPGRGGAGKDVSVIFGAVGGAAGVFGGGGGGGSTSGADPGGIGGVGGGGQAGGSNNAGVGHDGVANTGGGAGGNGTTAAVAPGTGGTGFASVIYHTD